MWYFLLVLIWLHALLYFCVGITLSINCLFARFYIIATAIVFETFAYVRLVCDSLLNEGKILA